MDLIKKATENAVFVLELAGIILIIFLAAYAVEKAYGKRERKKGRILSTKKLAMVGLFSAISFILMLFELPMPFAPAFYKIDFSEVPVLIITFAYGPVAGVLTEGCKILLKLLFRSTSTAFVGELANFAVGCSLVLPAGIVYLSKKSRKSAILGCILGSLIMTVFGSLFNGIYLLPTFAKIYGMPLESIIAMGTAITSNIHSVWTLVLFSVVPLNLVKSILVSLITIVLYKHLSSIIKNG